MTTLFPSQDSRLSPSWSCNLLSPQDTERLGLIIGTSLQGGEILFLVGDLGAGKTTLVKGIAKGAGIDPELVSSPTFTLIQEYDGRVNLVHVDLYRIQQFEDMLYLGLSDYFGGPASIAIEWADRAEDQLPADHLHIHLTHQPPQGRSATLQSTGAASHSLLHRIRSHNTL